MISNIGARLSELRKALNISQGMLARSAGVSQSSISFIENGTNQPTIVQLEKLCTALGVTLSEFFREDKPEEEVPFDIKELTELAAKLTTEERAGLLIMLRAFVTRHTSTPGE